ncbi:hypothetical protein AVEN_57209-1, partial [Araneus ventricosus]
VSSSGVVENYIAGTSKKSRMFKYDKIRVSFKDVSTMFSYLFSEKSVLNGVRTHSDIPLDIFLSDWSLENHINGGKIFTDDFVKPSDSKTL